MNNEHDARGIAGFFSDGSCTAASDPSIRINIEGCDATLLPGAAMKETIRAFLLGLLILLTALIPPTILLVEYLRH